MKRFYVMNLAIPGGVQMATIFATSEREAERIAKLKFPNHNIFVTSDEEQ